MKFSTPESDPKSSSCNERMLILAVTVTMVLWLLGYMHA